MSQVKNRRVVLLPDIHHPYYEKKTFGAVKSFVKWFKPHTLILLGDAMNMDSVSHWLRSQENRRYLETLRLKKEYSSFIKDILNPLEKAVPSSCKKIYMGGNHEDWVEQLLDKEPQLEGCIEIPQGLNLKERGWKWIPYLDRSIRGRMSKNFYDIGKLRVFHGAYTNKHHSSKTADVHSKSIVYGHTHDVQTHTKVFADDLSSFHIAQAIGCLCQKNLPYLKGNPNNWVNAFGIVYVRPNGDYNVYLTKSLQDKGG